MRSDTMNQDMWQYYLQSCTLQWDIYLFFFTCTQGVELWCRPLMLPPPHLNFPSVQFWISKPKAQSNQTCTETPANTNCTMLLCRVRRLKVWLTPYYLYYLIHMIIHTTAGTVTRMQWTLLLNLHDLRVESWFESWVWDCIWHHLNLGCSRIKL